MRSHQGVASDLALPKPTAPHLTWERSPAAHLRWVPTPPHTPNHARAHVAYRKRNDLLHNFCISIQTMTHNVSKRPSMPNSKRAPTIGSDAKTRTNRQWRRGDGRTLPTVTGVMLPAYSSALFSPQAMQLTSHKSYRSVLYRCIIHCIRDHDVHSRHDVMILRL
jgi:hypothetical protein